jgi:lipopolysaccharide export system protein LptA
MSSAVALPNAPAGFRAWLSGMARPGQVLSSFAAVFGIYCLYWLFAVPLIEPNVDHEASVRTSEEEIDKARGEVSSRQRDVAQYFPPGSWELETPAIWQSDQSRLLFKTLRPLPDGTVELCPCTLLFFPKSSAAAAASGVQPIVLRAPEGANVRFDEPIVLKNVDLAKRQLVGGRLIGPITIYRTASRPGANDDLEITTHDVEMLDDRIFTPHPVQFRLGRNHGSGRDMEILMASADGSKGKGFRNGTVRSLELKRDVKMQLEVGNGPLASGAAAAKRASAEPPMDITCQGSFQFDVARNSASFHDNVNVFRPNAVGESDQLSCEVLTTFFESHGDKPAATQSAAPAAAGAETPGLRVRRIEARGDPVVVRSPGRGIYVHCRGIDYSPGSAGAMGSLVAMGPGVLQGNLPNDTQSNYDAKWASEFRFEPAEGTQHRAALMGNAVVRFPQMGTIQADEIFAWLTPKNPPAPGPAVKTNSPSPPGTSVDLGAGPTAAGGADSTGGGGWQLERMLARVHQEKNAKSQGKVVIDSPQLHGITGQLEAWVDRPQSSADRGQTPANAADSRVQSQPQEQPAPKSARTQQNPTQRYDLRGGRIRLQLVPEGEQLALSTVTVENEARLNEISPARAGEKPLVVAGDRLHVSQANTPATKVTVSGRPGYLEAGGITLRGAAIELEKQTNRLWIDGPGSMTMPVEQDLNGQPVAHPQKLDITWEGGMAFKGNSVVYQRNVAVRTDSQLLKAEKLEAVFDRPIDFSNPNAARTEKSDDKPQLTLVRCFGRALLKSRQLDERGQQTSVDELNALDLTMNKVTGDVAGSGPGSLTHVGRGSGQAALGRPGALDKPPAQNAPRAENELTYLNVQFRTFLDGNLNRRMTRFGEPTKAVYGPVSDWNAKLNPDDPASLGPQGLVLDAKQLEVVEMPARGRRDRGWFELKAAGNVVAEGSQFTARGDHLTYSEEKDQLLLRGDGLSPAEFFQDNPADGSRRASRADELTYWFTLQRVQVTSFQSFDMQVPNNSPPKTPKKKSILN